MEEAQELAALACRLLLGLMFLRSSVAKLLDARDFEFTVSRYEVLPARLVRPVGRWIPRVELFVAVMLLAGVGTRFAALVVAALLAVFAAAIAINLLRGRSIDCGCHSSTAPEQIHWRLVGRDLGLAFAATFVAYAAPVVLSVDGAVSADASVPNSDAFAVLVAASTLYLGAVLIREARVLRSGAARLAEPSGGRS